MLNINLSAISLFLFSLNALTVAQGQNTVGAVYFMTNDQRENSIVVHDVLFNGTLKYSGSFPTRGKGSINLRVGSPTPDSLRTQGSVVVSGNKLYATNAGSNSVSMFEINATQPNQLRLIGNPVYSGGEFPASVAVSSKTGNVCVLNGGSVNGVRCLQPTAAGLVEVPETNRLLNLTQTFPPTFSDTSYSISTILFSRDETKLAIDVKGLQQEPKVPGFLAVWDVMPNGSLSTNYTMYPAPSTSGALNFGMSLLNGTDGFVVTDPLVGGTIYDFSKGYEPANVRMKRFEIPGQTLVCWVNFASKSNSYFLTDFGAPFVFEALIDNETLNVTTINTFQLPATTINVDNVIGTVGNDQYLYQLAPFGTGLFVFDIQPDGMTKMIQSYNYTDALTSNDVKFTVLSPQGLAFMAKA